MKIAIIKLGALGDVVRTTPIIQGIREKYKDAEITWITKKSSKELLENNPLIKQVLVLPLSSNHIQEFDILYSLDIEDEAIKLANIIKAKKKLGFYEADGFPSVFNLGAEYYLNTTFDDELKINNRKTYQEMIFEVCELKYNKEKPIIVIPKKSTEFAKKFIEDNNLSKDMLIGLNIGSSKRWPSKAWSREKIISFIELADKEDYQFLLLGGEEENNIIDGIKKDLKNKGIIVHSLDTSNSIMDFAALISVCKAIISADTLALHLSLALNKKTIGLFFCTSPYEIEEYGLLTKIISSMLLDFFPAKSDEYNEELVNSISIEEVFSSLKKITNNKNHV